MTVAELREILAKMPDDTEVPFEEMRDALRGVAVNGRLGQLHLIDFQRAEQALSKAGEFALQMLSAGRGYP